MNIHAKIKALRLRAGWTQEVLAEKAEVSHRAAFNWEHKSRPRGLKLMKLAEVFGIDPEILTNDSLDLPSWEPTERVRKIYPSGFTEHLKMIKEDSEEYLVDESRKNRFIDLLEQTEKLIHELIYELKGKS